MTKSLATLRDEALFIIKNERRISEMQQANRHKMWYNDSNVKEEANYGQK